MNRWARFPIGARPNGRPVSDRIDVIAPQLRSWWLRRRRTVLVVLAAGMAVEATAFLLYEFWRLLLEHGFLGATDLNHRLREAHAWFAGRPVYGHIPGAVYPPVTPVLLWPFVGWLDLGPARWLWGLVTLASLAWLVVLIVRETGARSRLERAVVALAVLAMYPTGATVGDGQLLITVLPLLLTGLALLRRPTGGLRVDLLAALLLLAAMVKGTAVAPFLVVAALAPWRKRPLVLACLAYTGLTLFAVSFQHDGVVSLFRQWLHAAADTAAGYGSANYANVQGWLGAAGLRGWVLPASALVIVAFAYWAWRHRNVDPWILIGVAGYVARFWTYHRQYDDLLIVLPMVALYRIARAGSRTRNRDVIAGVLLAATLAVLLWPGGMFGLPIPLRVPFTSLEAAVWLAGLGFLLVQARWAHAPRARGAMTSRAQRPAGLTDPSDEALIGAQR